LLAGGQGVSGGTKAVRVKRPGRQVDVNFGGDVMESGIMIRWGMPRQGREKEALDLYQKSAEYYSRLVAEGRLTYGEPFLLASGDSEVESGFFLLKGDVANIFALLDDQQFRDLMARGSVLIEHFRFEMLAVGESIQRTLGEYQRALQTVGV
jgi:hypothetical protein